MTPLLAVPPPPPTLPAPPAAASAAHGTLAEDPPEASTPTDALAHLRALKATMGDQLPAEAVKMIEDTLHSKQEETVTPALVYRMKNARKLFEKARDKVRSLDSSWEEFCRTMAARVAEQKELYLQNRKQAHQLMKEKEMKYNEIQQEIYQKASLSTALDEIPDELLEATLQDYGLQEAMETEEMEPMETGADLLQPKTSAPSMKPFHPTGKSPKRKGSEDPPQEPAKEARTTQEAGKEHKEAK